MIVLSLPVWLRRLSSVRWLAIPFNVQLPCAKWVIQFLTTPRAHNHLPWSLHLPFITPHTRARPAGGLDSVWVRSQHIKKGWRIQMMRYPKLWLRTLMRATESSTSWIESCWIRKSARPQRLHQLPRRRPISRCLRRLIQLLPQRAVAWPSVRLGPLVVVCRLRLLGDLPPFRYSSVWPYLFLILVSVQLSCRPTTAEIVCATPDFTTLCSLVVDAGLDDDLAEGLWTVFAPNNEAFAKAADLLSDIDSVEEVLLFHTVANDKLLFDDLVCGEVRIVSSPCSYSFCCTTHELLPMRLAFAFSTSSPPLTNLNLTCFFPLQRFVISLPKWQTVKTAVQFVKETAQPTKRGMATRTKHHPKSLPQTLKRVTVSSMSSMKLCYHKGWEKMMEKRRSRQ